MKKLFLVGVLALAATGSAVYAYRTVHVNADRGDRPFTFICPLTGEPMCHRACPSEAPRAEVEKVEPACCKKPVQANP